MRRTQHSTHQIYATYGSYPFVYFMEHFYLPDPVTLGSAWLTCAKHCMLFEKGDVCAGCKKDIDTFNRETILEIEMPFAHYPPPVEEAAEETPHRPWFDDAYVCGEPGCKV